MRRWFIWLGLALILFGCGGDEEDDSRLNLLEEELAEAQSELEKAKEEAAIVEREETIQIVDALIDVRANQFEEFVFELPIFAWATLEGDFSSVGGADGLIEVMVFTELDFFKWKAFENPVSEWASGRVKRGTVEHDLRGSGIYYLVVSNQKAFIFKRTVKIDFKVTYIEPG
ncbi:hypothetical protein IH992_04110 [Candidatus Poribacteria bacterium]|nr:hypothetical protein [Candidatus Poribacteria bacterium]